MEASLFTRARTGLLLIVFMVPVLLAGGCSGFFAGPRVADVDYNALSQEIQRHTARLAGVTFGMYVHDLASGDTLELNAHTPLPAASSIKVPIALHMYRDIARGHRRFDDRLTFQQTHMTGGTGVLQAWAQEGDEFSLRFLLNMMITISDNVAWWMLDDHGGREKIAAFMEAAGGATIYPDGRNLSTARDMGAYLASLIEFQQAEPELGGLLLNDLQHTLFEDGIRGGIPTAVPVAHKVGSLSDVANDIAIVGGDRPYILAILSEGHASGEAGFAAIEAIAETVHGFQQDLPAAAHVDPFPR